MMSISVEAAEARDSLTDDKELVNTYEVRITLPYSSYLFIYFIGRGLNDLSTEKCLAEGEILLALYTHNIIQVNTIKNL